MRTFFFDRLHFLYLLLIASLLTSCVGQRRVEYLQAEKSQKAYNSIFEDYKLQPNDELYIKISSLDDASANIFSGNNNQNMGNINSYGASLMSYTVNGAGFIELPVVGRLLVKDKTISQITTLINDALVNVLNQPLITVKLVNRYISVLGEVRNPGHFVYAQDKLTIFDAIGLAGDITDYGNRKTILLLRNENGVNQRIEINTLSSDILSSPYYYLKPNDIVYVSPLRKKFWGLRQFPFSILLSSITTTILVLNYLK